MTLEKRVPGPEKVNSKVVVIYKDDNARDQAVRFCDGLVARFWPHYNFDINWWSYQALTELESTKAVNNVLELDLLVFAGPAEEPLPLEVHDWIERWSAERGEREGALVDLIGSESNSADTHFYLRAVAHRAKMDYLTQMPQHIPRFIPESRESYWNRAAQITSVLDEILQHHVTPPRILAS